MIKGIFIVNSLSDINHIPLFVSASVNNLPQNPDTLNTNTTSSSSSVRISKSKIINVDSISLDRNRMNKLFQIADERERQILKPKLFKQVEEKTDSFIGSNTRVYSDFTPSFQKLPDYNASNVNENFLQNIFAKNIDIHYKVKDSVQRDTSRAIIAVVPKEISPVGFEGKIRNNDTNGWYILVLLISISIFAWGKSLYQKYLLHILTSIYNYQLSIQLFRDKNVLFRNLSIILQVLFPINVGLLLFFIIEYYNFNQISTSSIASIAVYSFVIFFFFQLKTLVYKFLGHVFKIQEDFYEIQHHMTIFNQVLGVVLLPFVISMPFLHDLPKAYSLIILYVLLGILILLFFLRGIQIVNRKHVSFFFLILYLCAVEILPVVLLVKASKTII